MFLVFVEIEIRMSELLKIFWRSLTCKFRECRAEKAEEVSRSFECRFLEQVFGTRVFPKWRVSKAEGKARCFSNGAKSKAFSWHELSWKFRFEQASGKGTLKAKFRGGERREDQEARFWLSWFNRELRESNGLLKMKNKHNDRIDVGRNRHQARLSSKDNVKRKSLFRPHVQWFVMFFVVAEIEIRMKELFTDFLLLFNF